MSKPRILIVEDEAIVAADLSSKLNRLGYDVPGIADSGVNVAAMTEDLRPQLILMDIQLKGPVDGIQAAEMIRERFDVPVVYLTAHSDAATLQRAKRSGPFGYILKPFDERDLATQIELALYKHQAEREIHAHRELLRVTLTSIADGVIATDIQGCVTFFNPVAESLTGWHFHEVANQPLSAVFQIVNEKTGAPLEMPLTRVLQEGDTVAPPNHTVLLTRNGRRTPIENSAAPILNAEGVGDRCDSRVSRCYGKTARCRSPAAAGPISRGEPKPRCPVHIG